MSDFLTRLVQRQSGTLATIQPRTRSMFAPAGDRPDSPMPDLPAIEPATSSGETHQSPEAPRDSITPMRPLSTALDTQRRVAVPVNASPATLLATGLRESEPPGEPPLVNSVAVPSVDMAKGPPMPLRNQSVKSDEHASGVSPRDGARLPEQRSQAPAGHARAVTPPPRLVESQHTGSTSRGTAPSSLMATGHQGQRGDDAGAPSSEPPVHVTIGRIEVTALPEPPVPKRKSPARPPAMSLEDYLARRHGGRV